MERVIKVADGITVANWLTFRQGDYPGLAGGAQCNHRGPYMRQMEAAEFIGMM